MKLGIRIPWGILRLCTLVALATVTASGQRLVTVPNYVHKDTTKSGAHKTLGQAEVKPGLKLTPHLVHEKSQGVYEIITEPSKIKATHIVVAQSEAPGSDVPDGTNVDLIVIDDSQLSAQSIETIMIYFAAAGGLVLGFFVGLALARWRMRRVRQP
jgi:hypothetical protein